MLAARLHAARDLRVETVAPPPPPGPDQVTIRVSAVGVCGSDLHTYLDGRIGDTAVTQPLILGHEFAGVIEAVGASAVDGLDQPLRVGQRVAVDPATPCWRCEFCEAGHPNLCRRLHFCGLFPDDGSLCERMNVAARSCFPVPDSLSDAGAALLEPLGVALHAVDLGKIRVGRSAVVIGCGPIGLLIIRLLRIAGADPIIAFDQHAWRTDKALAWGADAAFTVDADPIARLNELTGGRGADVVFEAAWADHTVAQAAEMARLGGRVVLVGIPAEDTFSMKHSTARRKGLTIVMSRRMKHTYPRTIALTQRERDRIQLDDLVSHRFPLQQAADAFALNVSYPPGLHKVVIEIG